MSTRKKFDKQFKIDAVLLVQSSEKSTFEIATDLGINPNTLWRWIKEFGQSKEKAFPGNGKSRDEEMRLLKKEVADLRLERDILKKAVVIFSQPERKNTNS
jgi:transposase